MATMMDCRKPSVWLFLFFFVPVSCFLPSHQRSFAVRRSNSNRMSQRDIERDRKVGGGRPTIDAEQEDESFVKDDYFQDDSALSRGELEAMTVSQLKQMLRLRGSKVSGKKAQLVDRLLQIASGSVPTSTSPPPPPGIVDADVIGQRKFEDSNKEDSVVKKGSTRRDPHKQRTFAEKLGLELTDVSKHVYSGKSKEHYRSLADIRREEERAQDDEEEGEFVELNKLPGIATDIPFGWGANAKVLQDCNEGRVILDSLTRNMVEFIGSNQTECQAYVVASRDALKPFLAGGVMGKNESAEEKMSSIQVQRENRNQAEYEAKYKEDETLEDEGDDMDLYRNAGVRDYGDWGMYSMTGAQISAKEVKGLIVLSDVHGPFTNNTKALVEKIAFECQPIVVMAPDIFRDHPWEEVDGTGKNTNGETYEEWRETHSGTRVNVDIRAAAACLRNRYGVDSVSIWGMCYGGGRALEAASGWAPTLHDVDGSIPPPFVNPMSVVAWYPTRYNATNLFGKQHGGKNESFAAVAIFAGNDTLPGATPEDAALLKSCLEKDPRVKDLMIKVFPDQEHGFAHNKLAAKYFDEPKSETEQFIDEQFNGGGRLIRHNSDADVASLLSTSFMETYSRNFLPTVGISVRDDPTAKKWHNLQMHDLSASRDRDIFKEVEDTINNHVVPDDDYVGLSEEEQTEKTKRALMSYQSEIGDESPDYRLKESDTVEEMIAKIGASEKGISLW
mmetsp:Transcript_18014/g.41674  ORF Transcript_18014/g.41674 Transcript_18014/m.41674 type:complete len:729 (+) Transcript_18014:81-2267(+)